MTKNNHAAALPVLDPALGERIRHVVDMFDRKKDAAEVAGVIPEQLNRWCQAQSEPRFVGVARLASAQAVRLEWIVTGRGPVHIDPPAAEPARPPQTATAPDKRARHPASSSESHVQHMALSEIVGPNLAARSAQSAPRQSTKSSADGTSAPHTPKPPGIEKSGIFYNDHGLLFAIVTGFLTAEGINDAPRITRDILAAYDEIITLLGDELSQADTGMMIAQIVSAIIRRHSINNRRDPKDSG
ncbi:hypothetical protein [Thalassospira mesophila]|uniref:Uncharacterized protein n=1 Tax=Thalassospira mesophila TaxID=1293891 RepID=A0A1Y2L3I1_9PROT|nr:hypothetical protein [Thalassospira mesophila]OSQ38853.1 hypothetical protein TMES_08805 [Thalassospira mesophila]